MFGTYRYILALMVAAAHLAPFAMLHLGFYSVFAFFMLSGYLMSLVLNKTYLHLEKGLEKYMTNRLLRIFPAYFIVLFLSAIAAYYFPEIAKAIHEKMILPSSTGLWIGNISILAMTAPNGLRIGSILVPPAWSLAVEIVFWTLIGLIGSSKPKFAIWGIVAISYTLYETLFDNSTIISRYYSYPAGALPFFAGAVLYKITRTAKPVAPIFAYAALLVSALYSIFSPAIFNDPEYYTPNWSNSAPLYAGFYIAMAINFITIYCLSLADVKKINKKLIKIDSYLGDLAYPIFLLHVLTAVILVSVLDNKCATELCGRGWELFILTFPFFNIFAILLLVLVEKPISLVRERIKV